MTTVGVAIPTIAPRAVLLRRALTSVLIQSRPPDAISVVRDVDHDGAAHTRNRAWRALETDWVCLLDDDDEFHYDYIERCLSLALAEDADMVFPGCEVQGGTDPHADGFGKPWDPANPRQTTITCLWRRSALEKIGGFPAPGDDVDAHGNRCGEDFAAVLRLNEMGGKIVHLPERLWTWWHHAANTSGRPEAWA